MEHKPMKLGMVIMMQPNLQKAVEFYRDVLKLPLRFHLEGKWAEFDLGNAKLGLCPIEQGQDNIRTGIVLEVQEDLLELFKALKDTVHFYGEPVVAPHGIMVGFKDVGGNVLDLYQPTLDKLKDLVKETVQKG